MIKASRPASVNRNTAHDDRTPPEALHCVAEVGVGGRALCCGGGNVKIVGTLTTLTCRPGLDCRPVRSERM